MDLAMTKLTLKNVITMEGIAVKIAVVRLTVLYVNAIKIKIKQQQ
jgi:hypothetical protein